MEKVLYLEIYLICLLILGFILYSLYKGENNSTTGRWLKYIVATFMICFSANLLFSFFRNTPIDIKTGHILSYVFKSLYYIFFVLTIKSWSRYVECELGFENNKERSLGLYINIWSLLTYGIILSNFYHHQLFVISNDGVYTRGSLYHLMMICFIAITSICSYMIKLHASTQSDPLYTNYLRNITTFPLGVLLAYILSFAGESVPVICVTMMFELLFVYESYSNNQISTDKLTKVNNRGNLMSYLSFKIGSHNENLYLMMIDIDFFKRINDEFGHLVGDEALIEVADILKQSCTINYKRPYIARYGGDEFMIIVDGNENEVETLKQEIFKNIKSANEIPDKKYKLSLSIGVSILEDGMDLKTFINDADQRMYEIKRHRHKIA